jgi:bifunctional non-homologous end joining protein LigD
MRINYYIFDLLFSNGRSFMELPYNRRRQALEDLGIAHPYCRVPPSFRGDGSAILAVAREHRLEGILCKKLDSVYLPGVRSRDWLKVKLIKSGEFAVGGFTYVRENRGKIGSLLLGAYDNNMSLHFVGSVGSGFSDYDHRFLLSILEPIKAAKSPFEEKVGKNVNFTAVKYVAEVRYRRWPKGGRVQQCTYKGIRKDKTPAEIRTGDK